MNALPVGTVLRPQTTLTTIAIIGALIGVPVTATAHTASVELQQVRGSSTGIRAADSLQLFVRAAETHLQAAGLFHELGQVVLRDGQLRAAVETARDSGSARELARIEAMSLRLASLPAPLPMDPDLVHDAMTRAMDLAAHADKLSRAARSGGASISSAKQER